MKTLLIMGTLLLSMNSFAGNEKGNGGSGFESKLVGQQAQLESVALKLRSFFLKNEAALKPVFPEFDIKVLAKKIKMSDIRVVDEDKLIDKNGKDRTCLNFFNSSLIECKSSEIEQLLDQPTTVFVLVLHEYLGLIGVEETSPKNPTMIDGYKISKRIAPYVAKVSNYDLELLASPIKSSESDYCVKLVEKYIATSNLVGDKLIEIKKIEAITIDHSELLSIIVMRRELEDQYRQNELMFKTSSCN